MTLKEYRKIRWVFVVTTAIIFSQTIYYKNYLFLIAVLLIASLIHLYLRRQVKEILADERDYAIGGKAALWAIQIYSWTAVIAMFMFYSFRDLNPAYEPIGLTLAFSTCILMLTYAVMFRYYNRVKFTDKKFVYSVLILVFFAGMFIFAARLFSGEDDWICQNGRWVEHGHPDFPAPEVECK
ncbi:MAG: DUF2178 domain-containing protein [Candidatus Pacebacteria bacterium]|nr:DUF2178 domain-containing protein [Candidatus Paceibacterota bacterium]